MPRITPNLWCNGNAQEAVDFYLSVFPNSRITATADYPEGAPGPAGELMMISFELDRQPFVAINAGDEFSFSEAVSFEIRCADQDEVDRYWDALTADGGEEGPCGWCKDRFGLSWQVVPEGMDELFADGDGDRAARAFQAMTSMKKLDVAALRAAADGAVPA